MGSSEPWTVLRLINWTKDFFDRKGVDDARLSAEVLLGHVLGCPRVQLYARFDRLVEPDRLAAYRELVQRAGGGEPVAYLIGSREFYSLSLLVTPDVLIPRPETELLVDEALRSAKGLPSPTLWDACTGSGCVAVAAAKYEARLSVLATDISEPALKVAQANAERHGVSDRVRLVRADLLDWPADAGELAQVDVITANPPYVAAGEMAGLPPSVRREPEIALCSGPTGLEAISRIVADAPDRLKPGGLLAMEIALGQADKAYALLKGQGRYAEIAFRKDSAGIDRVVVARMA